MKRMTKIERLEVEARCMRETIGTCAAREQALLDVLEQGIECIKGVVIVFAAGNPVRVGAEDWVRAAWAVMEGDS